MTMLCVPPFSDINFSKDFILSSLACNSLVYFESIRFNCSSNDFFKSNKCEEDSSLRCFESSFRKIYRSLVFLF